jgi:hypothetical protein
LGTPGRGLLNGKVHRRSQFRRIATTCNVQAPSKLSSDDWRKAKPIQPGSSYPAKENCSNCGQEIVCHLPLQETFLQSTCVPGPICHLVSHCVCSLQGCVTLTMWRTSKRRVLSWEMVRAVACRWHIPTRQNLAWQTEHCVDMDVSSSVAGMSKIEALEQQTHGRARSAI